MRFPATKKICFFLFTFVVSFASAQTKFTADAVPRTAGRDEYITLKLTVANGDNILNIQPPSLVDFNIISGPNQETEMNSVNGVTQNFLSLSFVLQPKRVGAINVGAATAVVDGKTYRSNPFTVTITNKRGNASPPASNSGLSSFMQMPPFDVFDRPKPVETYNDYILHKGENVPDKVNRNMMLRLQTDKTSVYVGEPLLATYKLYTRLKSESTLSKNPSFNGFSVIDMTPDQEDLENAESLNGRNYDTYIIRKAQLYPLQPGSITLGTATLDNRITFLKEDAQTEADVVTQSVSLSSKPITITVKPLPENGKPVDFNGAVGNFQLDTQADKNNFAADETGNLVITISGKGNMQLLTMPVVKWPAGIDAFAPKSSDSTDKFSVPLSGKKTFALAFSAERPGDYVIPPISFSYFDPENAAYKTLTTAPLSIHVSAAAGKKKNVLFTKATAVTETTGFFSFGFLLSCFGLAFFALILFFVMRKNRPSRTTGLVRTGQKTVEIPAIPPHHMSIYAAQNPLAKTEECLHKSECLEFYALLNEELRDFLSQRFAVPKEILTVKNLGTAMDAAGIGVIATLQTQQLLQDIDHRIYTPFEQNKMLHEMYARAGTLIQMLNSSEG